ncbi:RND family efflux transporter, MFP subunit [Poseidonocella pacifica]|uniref:RND family efflux transporter, MFP subunit n=1 Tax=Poseidonocella pacifica TaxID=871651 RepID=A0A1I0WQJ4_9RHOB|nr:efflux RND transporter periplasmic adaptor subunit [Poseidonocella pacifica]SFA90814.1 RND family efflux transporter, MFP subunit [Poseidonocella pacifica]
MKRFTVLLLSAFLAFPALAQDVPRPAKLMELTSGGATIERRFFGRVKARETVDLAFQVGGQVVEMQATEGERIDEGGLIAQLDLTDFELALEQANINLAKAQRDLARLERLSDANVPEVQIEDARTQEQLARVSVRNAQDQLDDATMTAPFDALVARRLVPAFATVSPGTPVVRLHDMSELRVDIDVPEVLFRSAKGGQGIELEASFPGDDARYPLEIREYEAETAQVGQTFSITLAFAQSPGDWLLPGASATVTARSANGIGDEIFVPETALLFGPDRSPSVMRYDASGEDGMTGTVTRVPVEIRVRSDGQIVLLSGAEPGDEIVTTGVSFLEDGQSVRRFTAVGE